VNDHEAGMNPLLLEHLTWPEIEIEITRGTTTVIVPVGAIEQHGPHLPLLVDAERGTAIGLRIARHLGDTLVAPTIRVGCSEHHMGFAGTISIRPETLEAICRDYCASLARHGFLDIYFVPSHGGNFGPLQEMLPRLRAVAAEVNPDARVGAFTDLLGIISVWRWVVEEESGFGSRVGGHADIAESSEMLHLVPWLVRVERAEKGLVGELDREAVERIFSRGLRAVTPGGVLGDPRGMDAALGEKLLDATSKVIAERLRESAEGEEAEEAPLPAPGATASGHGAAVLGAVIGAGSGPPAPPTVAFDIDFDEEELLAELGDLDLDDDLEEEEEVLPRGFGDPLDEAESLEEAFADEDIDPDEDEYY